MPAHVVTLVFTDLVGSTALKADLPGDDAAARNRAFVDTILTPHRERIERGLADRDARVVKTEGDAFFIVFGDPVEAVRWAADVQMNHAVDPITTPAGPLRVKIGMHTGSPEPDGDDFIGREVDYAARVAALATGGQVLASEATAALVRGGAPAGLDLHDHGPRDLRGIGRVPVFEVLYGGKRPQPLAAGAVSPSNLPPAPAGFVGRGDLLAAVRDRIRAGGVTALKGEGGIGKTALALTAAQAAREAGETAGGAVWINCELGLSLDACLREMASVFFDDPLDDAPERERSRRVAEHLATARAAVLLDNFETVADDAAIVRWLADRRPPTAVIVTTREAPPGLRGEVLDVRELSRDEAVALFAERRTERGGDPGDAREIDRLCAAVGDLPLAIELLAARRVPVSRLVEQVERDLAAVDSRGDVTRPDRHRSARACFDMSYRHLDEPARDLLLRLSLMPDGAGPALVSAVAGTDDWDAAAEALVDASVWRLADGRYTVHPLIRRFAVEDLGTEREAVTRDALRAVARLALERGGETEPGRTDADTMVRALDWCEAELQNLVACARAAQASGDRQAAGDIAHALKSFFLVRGHWQLGAELFDLGLAARRAAGDRAGEGVLLNALGGVAYCQHRWDAAADAFEQSVAIRRETGDRSEEAKTLNNLSIVRMAQGRWDDAEARCHESIALWRDLADRQGEGTALLGLATILYDRKEMAEAEAVLKECLTIWRQAGDRVGEHKTLANLGNLCWDLDRLDESEQHYRASLAIRRDLGDRTAEGEALSALAQVHQKQGRSDDAIDLIRRAVAVLENTEAAESLAEARRLLAAWQEEAS